MPRPPNRFSILPPMPSSLLARRSLRPSEGYQAIPAKRRLVDNLRQSVLGTAFKATEYCLAATPSSYRRRSRASAPGLEVSLQGMATKLRKLSCDPTVPINTPNFLTALWVGRHSVLITLHTLHSIQRTRRWKSVSDSSLTTCLALEGSVLGRKIPVSSPTPNDPLSARILRTTPG